MNLTTAGNPNKISELVQALDHTRVPLNKACEELDLDYTAIIHMNLGIDQCTHCGIWSRRLILDLDQNPICTVCRDIAGL